MRARRSATWRHVRDLEPYGIPNIVIQPNGHRRYPETRRILLQLPIQSSIPSELLQPSKLSADLSENENSFKFVKISNHFTYMQKSICGERTIKFQVNVAKIGRIDYLIDNLWRNIMT